MENNTDKHRFAQQLRQHADMIEHEDDIEIRQELLSSCLAYLRMIAEIEDADEDGCIDNEIFAAYLGIAGAAAAFFNRHSDVMNALKISNDELRTELETVRDDYSQRCDEQSDLIEELNGLKANLNDVIAQIQSVPEEIRKLHDDCKEKEQLLSELTASDKEFSPERQEELQQQIDKLVPVVAANSKKVETLNNRIESLKEQNTDYDSEKHTLSTNVIELINSDVEELKSVLSEHEEYLQDIAKTADELAESVAKCQKTRDEYSNWIDSIETPLETMIKNLNYPESVDLRKTLNINQVETVKDLTGGIHRDLLRLDQILATCVDATRKDLNRIRRRAGQ